MKTLIMWTGAFVLGIVGGFIGARLDRHSSATELASLTKAPAFELVDHSGRTVSIWTTDRWGRPYLGMGDAKWQGRILIGPIMSSEGMEDKSPEWDVWGIEVVAPGAAHAALGTTVPLGTKKATGFITLQSEEKSWFRDADRP